MKKWKEIALATKQNAGNAWLKATSAVMVGLAATGAHASAFDDILDGVDLGSVATKIVAVGLLVVGIYLAMQGISVAKRVISKV